MNSYDEEEQEIIAAFEAGTLKSQNPSPETLAHHRAYARSTMIKDQRINIRLSAKDLEDIKIRAMEDGIPYQTLMGSILHKYVTGRLIERTGA